MKVSTHTSLVKTDGQVAVHLSAEGFYEHGTLPGLVDFREYLDELRLEEKALLDKDGHRVPVTVFSLNVWSPSVEAVEAYMKTEVDGPVHAAWTAGDGEIEFLIASTAIEGMKVLRNIHKAALNGRAFAESPSLGSRRGLRIVMMEDEDASREG